MARNFQNLEIWKPGCKLAEATYKAFSGSREFDFKSQMVRSSLSIPSNIAEGSERRSEPDFIRFCLTLKVQPQSSTHKQQFLTTYQLSVRIQPNTFKKKALN
jgi:hypothetical protein